MTLSREERTRRIGLLFVWAVLPLAASAIVLTHRRRVWFFYDEWGLVYVVVHGGGDLAAATTPFNGHLWFFPYLVYRAHFGLFGLTSHTGVYLAFTAGLVALSIAVALTLHALRVPALPAVAGGIAVTYFGTGAQSMVFAVILSANAALLFVLLAGVVALRCEPRLGPAIAVASLLVLATGCDSSVTAAAAIFVVVIVVARWRGELRAVGVALVPPFLAGVAWLLHAGTSGEIDKPIPWPDRLEFAGRLLLRSIGGFVGGTEVAGAVIIVAAAAVIVPAIAAGRLRGLPLLGLVAGGLTALTISVVIAWTRAGIVGSNFFDFNRYLSQVALFALIALAPAIIAALPASLSRVAVIMGATIVFALVFVANLAPLADYRNTFEGWNLQTRDIVVQAVTILDHGCPAGTRLDPDGMPAGSLSPQITVRLLREARARGWLDFDPVAAVDPKIVARMCAARSVTRRADPPPASSAAPLLRPRAGS
ncbi:MAG TPA: hypothetical protein VIH82_11150 [Acidimicrobiia bacterium]